MQKYLVIAIPPNLRGGVADIATDVQSAIESTGWPGLALLSDADVAVLKGSDLHAREALLYYAVSATDKRNVTAATWAREKFYKWTGPTHEPD